jgi:rod shape-determining protein MreC
MPPTWLGGISNFVILMQELLAFFVRNRNFFSFIAMELVCLWLVFNKNSYQEAVYLSTANQVTGTAYQASDAITGYFDLRTQNDSLARVIAFLKSELENKNATYRNKDSLTFAHIPATVINNSIWNVNNYITLDKGLAHGVKPGMGVVSGMGVVGKVKAASENFSTVYSVLHSSMSVSSKLKRTGNLCSTRWDGKDYKEARLMNVPMHIPLQVGDTVLSSGFNSVFPPNTMIGVVSYIERDPSEIFQIVRITLSTDFSMLRHVYVVKNFLAPERDSLELETTSQ